jgi:hypothetical protein
MNRPVKNYHDEDVIRLLKELKTRDSAYPAGLHEKRRTALLALVFSLHAGKAGLTKLAGTSAAHGSGAAAPLTLGMKVTLTVLSTAIVGLSTYLGVTLYDNRDALRNLWGGGSPTPTLVSSAAPSGPQTSVSTPLPTATPIWTVTVTPTPVISATPESNPNTVGGTPTKPGLRYGNTKTPRPKPLK